MLERGMSLLSSAGATLVLAVSGSLAIAALAELETRHSALGAIERMAQDRDDGSSRFHRRPEAAAQARDELSILMMSGTHQAYLEAPAIVARMRGAATSSSVIDPVFHMGGPTAAILSAYDNDGQGGDESFRRGVIDEQLREHRRLVRAYHGTPTWSERVVPLSRWRNDFLMALGVICAAIAGAMFASVRDPKRDGALRIRDIAVGAGSGLIAYASLRGGRSVFMFDPVNEALLFRPWSMALSGLLVGIFSDRAYELLTAIVEALMQRIRAVIGADGQRGETARIEGRAAEPDATTTGAAAGQPQLAAPVEPPLPQGKPAPLEERTPGFLPQAAVPPAAAQAKPPPV